MSTLDPADKRPRQYAGDILALATPRERSKALALVPEHYREWVRRLIQAEFDRRRRQRGG